MGNDRPDRNTQPENASVPSNAAFDPPRRLEPLGEGYDERDRRIDATLSAEARMVVESTPIPEGLNERLMQGVQDALAASRAPLPMDSVTPQRRSTHALQRLALAACMGFAVVIGWVLIDAESSRLDQPASPLVYDVVITDPVVPIDTGNVQADLAMLTSSGEHEELDRLAVLIATRDMRFSDAAGDLTAVLDAMQNPSMQGFDVEVWR